MYPVPVMMNNSHGGWFWLWRLSPFGPPWVFRGFSRNSRSCQSLYVVGINGMLQCHRALPKPLHRRWRAGALWSRTCWRDHYKRWKMYKGSLHEVDIQSNGESVFSLDLVFFFLASPSTGGCLGEEVMGSFPCLCFHQVLSHEEPTRRFTSSSSWFWLWQ